MSWAGVYEGQTEPISIRVCPKRASRRINLARLSEQLLKKKTELKSFRVIGYRNQMQNIYWRHEWLKTSWANIIDNFSSVSFMRE